MKEKKSRKKALKFVLFFSLTILIIFIGSILSFVAITSSASLDSKKLINLNKTVTFYDKYNNEICVESDNVSAIKIENIPSNLINAFVAIEDKRFYFHNGIDYRSLGRAFFNNVKSFSFKEGASTISQQLIKNTHLSNEKTLKRKFIEIKLAKQLEKKYTKNQIMEMYLNTIYFGENCFGVAKACKFYFDKEPKNLNLNECAMLAGLVKAPSNYSPLKNFQKCTKRKNVVLKEMLEQKYITQQEYDYNANTPILLKNGDENTKFGYIYLAKKELNCILEQSNVYVDKLRIYTNYDPKIQKIAEESIKMNNYDCYNASIILDKDCKILSYVSNVKVLSRQIGSTIKPLLVYAPAVQLNQIDEFSLIYDEKTSFNGYSPSNYNDKYYGYVTAKDSLAKSLNIPSLKILQDLGIDNAKKYINKTDIELTENDNSLCIGLGATEKGATLKNLCASYSIFNNAGFYKQPFCINSIKNDKNKEIYHVNKTATKVFDEDTTFLVNEMLKETVNSGTAKKLKGNIPLYSKTGTVGNNGGNTDAYNVSFNKDYIIGTWLGNKENLMNNNITGGTTPTVISKNIWDNIYQNINPPSYLEAPLNVKKISLDKVSFDEEHIVELADTNTPRKYILEFYSKTNNLPNKISTRFTVPELKTPKTSVNHNGICFELCVTKPTNICIFKDYISDENLIFDSGASYETCFTDTNAKDGINTYVILPYVKINNEKICGKEKILNIKKDSFFEEDFWNE